MANRYVWQKYNRTSSYTEKTSTVSSATFSSSKKLIFTNRNPTYYAENDGYGVIIAADVYDTISYGDSYNISTDTYMMIVAASASAPYKSTTWYEVYSGRYDQWYIPPDELTKIQTRGDEDTDYAGEVHSFYKHTYQTTYSQGSTSYGYVSGASDSVYPSDNYSGSYWYVYKGYDCIDPTAVGYSKTTGLKGGDTITINVTKRSNTYGGTISYKYQYSTNGGSTWTDIATTTATSKSVTIPKGAKQFKARVLASDDMGFTSTTYVEGANLTDIKNGGAHAGVSGTVKAVVPVVCVGGAIKTNVSMYAGVAGTVKQC